MPYYPRRNEQAMVHAAAGYARQTQPARDARVHDLGRPGRDEHGHRRGAGDDQPPAGAAAARATSSRPARRSPVLQELEDPTLARRLGQRLLPAGVALLGPHRPRPSSSLPPLLAAMRVLTDPAETGAVTLALPAGRAGRGVRLARGAVRARASGTCAARRPSPSALGRGGRAAARRAAAADRRRRRRRSTPRRPTRCARSPRRPASRWPRRRPARARCPTTTR